MDTNSHSLRTGANDVPAFIQYNYFQFNHYIKKLEDYVDSWPRSYAVGVFGVQKADVHFNRFRNALMDFELVAGCKVGRGKLPNLHAILAPPTNNRRHEHHLQLVGRTQCC